MKQPILHQFLEANLFNISIDDPTYEKLEGAVESLLKKELKKKTEVPKFTLVALNSEISPDDPVLALVKEHVNKKSQTIISKSKDSPTTLLRAIILEALWKQSKKELAYAQMVWLTGSNVVEHYSFGREEEVIVKQFLKQIGEIVEQAAIDIWKTNQLVSSEYSPYKLDSVEIINPIETTVGELVSKLSEVQISDNYHYNNSSSYFKKWQATYSEVIETEINVAIVNLATSQNKNIKQALNSFKDKLEESLQSGGEYLKEIGNSITSTNESLNNRSQLLWWKEALYSSSQKVSYRKMDSLILPIIMAYDLYNHITTVYPVSADYFLMETLLKVLPKDNKTSFKHLIESLADDKHKEVLQDMLPENESDNGKIGLTEFISRALLNKVEVQKDLKNRVGVKPEQELTQTDFAIWVFHELQAIRISTAK